MIWTPISTDISLRLTFTAFLPDSPLIWIGTTVIASIMAPKGGNTKKESGRAKKKVEAENSAAEQPKVIV